MQMLMNCDGENIMVWRIPRTQKDHEKIKAPSVAYFNHETFYCSKDVGKASSPTDDVNDKGKHIGGGHIRGELTPSDR